MSIAQSWQPRHAWFFTGTTLVLTFLLGGLLVALAAIFPSFSGALHDPLTRSIVALCGLLVIFVVGLFFANVRTSADFIGAFSLARPSEREILLAIAVGFLLQFVGIYVFAGSLSHLQVSRSLHAVDVVVILAPFFEEPVMRGFVYRAFRNSYPVALSICLVVAISLIFHWGEVYGSLYGCAIIGALNAALCLLREKHSSLWSCISCHLAFNIAYVFIARQ